MVKQRRNIFHLHFFIKLIFISFSELLLVVCIIVGLQGVHPVEVRTKCTILYSICNVQEFKINDGDSLKIIAPNPSSVQEIYINQASNLVSIPYGIFENFPELVTFGIDLGGIVKLQSDRFLNAKKLEDLRLDRNDIRIVPSNVFVNVPTLSTIYLQDNLIETIEDNAFEGMINLRILRLDQNRISIVGRLMFSGAPNIRELQLDLNRIETIEESALNLPHLEELNLANNLLKIVSDKVLVAPNLVTLHLNKNPIESVTMKFLGDLEKLESLYLSDMKLKFPSESPQHLPTKSILKMIRLSNNTLSNSDLLRQLSIFGQLEIIFLDNNNFTVLEDVEKIRTVFPRLKQLSLEKNTPPLCNMIESNQQWLNGIIVWSGSYKNFCGSADFSIDWYVRNFVERG